MQGRDVPVPKKGPERQVHPEFPGVTQLLPEPKRLILEALRSDRFKQGIEALAPIWEDGTHHCCLGVICEVAIEAGVDVNRVKRPHADCLAYGGNTSMPPDSVVQWAYGTDIGVWQVVIEEDGDDDSADTVLRVRELSELNDNRRWSFEQIAQAIEDSL